MLVEFASDFFGPIYVRHLLPGPDSVFIKHLRVENLVLTGKKPQSYRAFGPIFGLWG